MAHIGRASIGIFSMDDDDWDFPVRPTVSPKEGAAKEFAPAPVVAATSDAALEVVLPSSVPRRDLSHLECVDLPLYPRAKLAASLLAAAHAADDELDEEDDDGDSGVQVGTPQSSAAGSVRSEQASVQPSPSAPPADTTRTASKSTAPKQPQQQLAAEQEHDGIELELPATATAPRLVAALDSPMISPTIAPTAEGVRAPSTLGGKNGLRMP